MRQEAKPAAVRRAHGAREPLFSLSAGGEFAGDRSLRAERVWLKQSVARKAGCAAEVTASHNSLPSAPVSSLLDNRGRAEEKMPSGETWQGPRAESRAWGTGAGGGQADPSGSLGGFLKPFLGTGVDRNRVTRLQGKQAMLLL